MDETSALMKKAHAAHEHGIVLEDDSSWGGTPELRKLWSNKLFKPKLTAEVSSDANYGSYEEESGIGGISRQPSIDESDNTQVDVEPYSTSDGLIDKMRGVASHCMVGTPGLIIALVLNLFLSMSFGQAFFPTSWQFPVGIPRAIGVQMFLFSTLVSQLVMTAMSEFPTAMGMMMVENIPFMHIIAQIAVKQQGPGIETFSTVFVTFALSTIVVGIAFYILGAFKIGNAVYFFPRHVIIGCIGGIGIFIIQTGVEVSCDRSWEWSVTSIAAFAQTSVAVHWLASLAFVALLRVLLAVFNAPLLPPFYFVAIPPAFYLLLVVCGITQLQARQQNWFFPAAENVDPLLIWELIDFRVVNWKAVGDCIPTIIALSLFRYQAV
jgi:SulP family sulfate permease